MSPARAALRRLALAVPALLLVLSGCGPGAPGEGDIAGGTAGADSLAPAPVPLEVAALLDSVRASGGRVTLLNVWASWCVPCREEFPDLVALGDRHRERGLRLEFVSADFGDDLLSARRFLAAQGIHSRTWLKDGDDMTFINTLSPEWSGALPACFVYDAAGRLRDHWEGRIPFSEMERRVLSVLDSAPQATPS